MIKTYKALSLLLDYPSIELSESLQNIVREVKEEGILNEVQLMELSSFSQSFAGKTVEDWQREYVQQFDYSPQTNLYLFDHVHGHSKERGQAMLDLKEMYEKMGLEVDNKELPDYIPVFLEYIAITNNRDTAAKLLADIEHILDKIGKKLNEEENPYGFLINILISIAKQYKKEDKINSH